eukprot:745987-Hanusia_phi.AAC.1
MLCLACAAPALLREAWLSPLPGEGASKRPCDKARTEMQPSKSSKPPHALELIGLPHRNRKDELLKQLAASDRPSGKAPEVSAPKEAAPDWIYFFFPILGAVTAFAVQYFTKNPLPLG